MSARTLLLAVIIGLPAGAALADPCEGALPTAGAACAGQVQYVCDGDSLCVRRLSDPATWIELLPVRGRIDTARRAFDERTKSS